jgi:hypothetical protein
MATFLTRRAAASATIPLVSDSVPRWGYASAHPDADLLILYRRYREARQEMHKVFAERVCSDAESVLLIKRCDAILRDIAKMDATTLRGFGAKMDVLRSCECTALERVSPQDSDEVLLQSIVADSYRLFGAGEELASGRDEMD